MINLLVVEDDDIIRKMCYSVFSRQGYNVQTAVNGKEALNYLNGKNNGSIDIVLTNHSIPIMDGLELTKEIRDIERYNNLPIIMVSGGTTDEKEALAAGANEFIEKPYKLKDLKSTFEKYLNLN